MESSRESKASIESLLAEAIGEPDLAAEATRAIDEVLAATETRVVEIGCRAEEDSALIGAELEERARIDSSSRRAEIALLRAALTERASGLALRFEALLDMLEEAEKRFAERAGEPSGEPAAEEEEEVAAIKFTLRKRQKITFAKEPTAPGAPGVIDAHTTPQPVVEGSVAPRRRRWWRRWLREAA